MERARSFLKRCSLWWGRQRLRVKLLIIAGVGIVFLVIVGGKPEALVIENVVQQDLARTVAATGTVVSTTDLALSFQQTNLVRSISVSVGSTVRKGQILATLENASEAAAVASARGALLAAQARERKVIEGTSGDEVRSAEIALQNARRTLYSTDLIAKDDAGDTTGAPTISGAYSGEQAGRYIIEFDRSSSEISFSGLERGRTSIGTTPKPLGTKGLSVAFPEGSIRTIGTEWIIEIPNRESSSYTTNLNAYNDALAALSLKKTVAPADVDVARADVVSAQASLASAQAAFEKTVIRAPADGTVTKVDIKLGQLAEAFTPVITIQDVGNLYIEANVNESNISFVETEQPVTVTYDALGRDMPFQTAVTAVDLGATVVDGIVNYKVKAVVPNPEAVRPGMTANLSIQTAFAPQVIVIPERVIKTEDGTKTVEVLVDEDKGKTQTRTIMTGLRGDGGLVEVLSGLSVGERVVFSQQ